MNLLKLLVRPSVGIWGHGFYVDGTWTYTLPMGMKGALEDMQNRTVHSGAFECLVDELYEFNLSKP